MCIGRYLVNLNMVYLAGIPPHSAGLNVKNTEAARTGRKQKILSHMKHRNVCRRDTGNKRLVEQSIRNRAATEQDAFLYCWALPCLPTTKSAKE